jgi:hypothetical protein
MDNFIFNESRKLPWIYIYALEACPAEYLLPNFSRNREDRESCRNVWSTSLSSFSRFLMTWFIVSPKGLSLLLNIMSYKLRLAHLTACLLPCPSLTRVLPISTGEYLDSGALKMSLVSASFQLLRLNLIYVAPPANVYVRLFTLI